MINALVARDRANRHPGYSRDTEVWAAYQDEGAAIQARATQLLGPAVRACRAGKIDSEALELLVCILPHRAAGAYVRRFDGGGGWTLFANRKVVVSMGRDGCLHWANQGDEAMRLEAYRDHRRRQHADYLARRAECVAWLQGRRGPAWFYCSGQMGGRYVRRDGSAGVSAPAVRAIIEALPEGFMPDQAPRPVQQVTRPHVSRDRKRLKRDTYKVPAREVLAYC